ncbi:MAG: hypothetical protein ACRD2T_05180, partial [Thermoanaerobaculia bacterium]
MALFKGREKTGSRLRGAAREREVEAVSARRSHSAASRAGSAPPAARSTSSAGKLAKQASC